MTKHRLKSSAKASLRKAKVAKLKVRLQARDPLGNISAPVVRSLTLRR